MELRESLYHIESAREEDGSHLFALRLNPDHVIYQAHFPGEPITPGVCILQMGVELLSEALGCPLEVAGFKNVKFLQVLSPLGTPSLTGRISGIVRDGVQVGAQCLFTAGEAVIAKMSVLCREEPKA